MRIRIRCREILNDEVEIPSRRDMSWTCRGKISKDAKLEGAVHTHAWAGSRLVSKRDWRQRDNSSTTPDATGVYVSKLKYLGVCDASGVALPHFRGRDRHLQAGIALTNAVHKSYHLLGLYRTLFSCKV